MKETRNLHALHAHFMEQCPPSGHVYTAEVDMFIQHQFQFVENCDWNKTHDNVHRYVSSLKTVHVSKNSYHFILLSSIPL